MIKRSVIASMALVFLFLGWMVVTPLQAQTPVVYGVLLYSPTCSHCEYVMTTVLPPLREKYGDSLYIAEIDTTQKQGGALFLAVMDRFSVPEAERGVPVLIIGEQFLRGRAEIPEQLPGLIETYLAAGGVGWPDFPDIEAIVKEFNLGKGGRRATDSDVFMRDPLGNGISTGVLAALCGGLGLVLSPRRWQQTLARRVLPSGFYVVMGIGLIAAAYLTYVEMTQTTAICGPVGDCNAVQQSQYAKLFGFFPVALLGLLGYLAILASHGYTHWIKGPGADYVPALTFSMVLFGLAFSIYLTYLEPFVIGATCAWCLASAVCMLLLALFTAGPGWAAWKAWRDDAWRRSAKRRQAAKARARKQGAR